MIVLDTNVVSETLRPSPNADVLTWLDAHPPQGFFLTAISVAELFAGVPLLPRGRRRTKLQRAVEAVLHLFDGRILDFDVNAASEFVNIYAAKGPLD